MGQLIKGLVTKDVRIITHTEPATTPQQYFVSGTVYAYVANVIPVVAAGTVAYRPVIGYLTSGTMIGVEAPPTTWQERIETTRIHAEVLDRLTRLTGKNFGYDVSVWQKWYAREYLPAQKAAADAAQQTGPAASPAPAGTGVKE